MFHLADFFTPFSAPLGTDLTVGRTSAWTGSSEGLGERGVGEVARQILGDLTGKGHRLSAILGFEVGRVELRTLQHADRVFERKRGECPTGHASSSPSLLRRRCPAPTLLRSLHHSHSKSQSARNSSASSASNSTPRAWLRLSLS